MTDTLSLPAHLFKTATSRRTLLAAAASAPALAATSQAMAAGKKGQSGLSFASLKEQHSQNGHILYEHLDFTDPAEKMRISQRLEFGLENDTYVWWYTFVLFGVTPSRSPVRLLRFEGMEMSEWRASGENEYIVHGHNVSFPQEYETGEYISKWKNPLTGTTIKTQPTLLTSDPGRRKTPAGDYDLADKTQTLRPEQTVMRAEGELLHKDGIRTPPDNWPGQFVETNTVTGALKDLLRSDAPSVAARGSGMWVQPFLKWMGMPKDSGHMVGYFSGRKMPSVEALPKAFYTRLTTEHAPLARVDPEKFTGEYWAKNKSGLHNVD
jgi:hypothetical protein